MKKSFAFIFALLLFLVGCNSADNSSALQSDDSPLEMTMPELEKQIGWQLVQMPKYLILTGVPTIRILNMSLIIQTQRL